MKNIYWKSIEEKNQEPRSLKSDNNEPKKEILEEIMEEMADLDSTSRRDFLKLCGFSLAAATIAVSCESKIHKAIPFLIKPEEVTSGIANYYASTFFNGSDYCSILVKTREGRPIKIEGNELSGITLGGTNARVQASVLSLYDTERLKTPIHKQKSILWNQADENIISLLHSFDKKKEKIVILSSSIISPSTKKIYKDFVNSYKSASIVYYDAISSSAILEANKISFGRQIIPNYRFDKANVIISFGADFLGTWLSPIEFTKQYVTNRKLDNKKTMSRHIQFEAGMSLTGSNADERFPIRPSEEGAILTNLYNEISGFENSKIENPHASSINIKLLAKELLNNRNKSLVISDSNDVNVQIIVNAINALLGNYGNTIDLTTPNYMNQGIDSKMDALVKDMNDGNIEAIIINNANPLYNYHDSESFVKGLKNVKLSISLSATMDETSSLVDYICPDNHYLESWNDAEPKKGFFSLSQPTINKLFDTRASQESLLKWIGVEVDFHDYIQEYWEKNIFPLQTDFSADQSGFRNFWIKSLQDGVFEVKSATKSEIHPKFDNSVVEPALDRLSIAPSKKGEFELHLYESIAIGDGNYANNPWLQELPDPISKVCWDNYAAISPQDASQNMLKNSDVISIISGSEKIEIPILVQPGQTAKTISIALGYGRKKAGKVGNNVGQNLFQFSKNKIVKIEKSDEIHLLALTQTHHNMEGRAIVRETSLEEYQENPSSGNEIHEKFQREKVSLYKDPVHIGNHWSLSIDLNACTGCGSCIIACQAENNIPVIGREEVRKRRIMHWIRIDRYYSDSVDNPKVYHQPIMCQHCDNAPCENVCPVSATMHSDDGLNHMTYNRCIGTRYCMNNCPYKVRRFNWFKYFNNEKFDFNMNNNYGKMVLNPDVVVRSRGVAEKCSLCVQRIQEMKTKAKLENRLLNDNEIKPACLQSCPADAIVFGNRNDKNSLISKKFEDKRNYGLLEEMHALPSVGYLVKVRNRSKKNDN